MDPVRDVLVMISGKFKKIAKFILLNKINKIRPTFGGLSQTGWMK